MLPVLESNDDAGPSTRDALLRTKLTGPRLKIGILNASVFDVVIDSVVSALDPTACEKATGSPARGDRGPFRRITRSRECTDQGCSPWREVGRQKGERLSVVHKDGATSLALVDNGGTYATFAGGQRTTADCLATTYCSIAAGVVRCDDFEEAIVVPSAGQTALDRDTCVGQRSTGSDATTPRFEGVLGASCASLSGGVRKTTSPTGTTETETVIVQSW